MRKTKIVCTIGPASDKVELLVELINEGMDVARLNFSHGTQVEHANRIVCIRAAAEEAQKQVAILLDTKGPEIRLGDMGGKSFVTEGDNIILTGEQITGTKARVSISYPNLANEICPGQLIMINDGLVTYEVEKIEGLDIYCVAKNNGEIGDHKGVNVPGVKINLPALSEKDKEDILFAVEHDMDFIAASFIRTAEDVLEIRKILEQYQSKIDIIAKIENAEGVSNIDKILKVADGIMVARGDLGVQIAAEEVPLAQKKIIKKCNAAGKPVITATQMLDSMIRNPRPTRAEASDVANAILDGTDAIMLSGETASGKYPLLTLQTMVKIAMRTEEALKYGPRYPENTLSGDTTITDAISHASFTLANDLRASAIITPTTSGSTARMVAKYRPRQVIVGATPFKKIIRKLKLVWGVYGLEVEHKDNTDEMFSESVSKALHEKLILAGDLVVITSGVPVGVPGTTNLIKVHVAGEIALKAVGIGKNAVTGRVLVVTNATVVSDVREGDILVLASLDRAHMPLVEKAAALVTEESGLTSSGAIVAINLGIPAIVGATLAVQVFSTGEIITIDAQRGLIYRGRAQVL